MKHIHKKVVVIGPTNVGKTTIITQLIKGERTNARKETTCHNSYSKTYGVMLRGQQTKMTLNVWDTPGGDQYSNMRDLDFNGADACIMVYCIDKESTFNKMEEVKLLADMYCRPIYFLVGNKVDLDRKG